MASFRNVLEDLVVREAKLRVSHLRHEAIPKLNVGEVIAYSLNRLPPMYATTQQGCLRLRARIRNEIGYQISETVRRAISAVQVGDPLHDPNPLPETELVGSATALAKLQKILGDPHMHWSKVPESVAWAISKAGSVSMESFNALSHNRRSNVASIKEYLRRSRERRALIASNSLGGNSDDDNTLGHENSATIAHCEFELYMSRAYLGYCNVLERLVLTLAELQISRLAPEIRDRIDAAEVTAFTLNRLPPMYATSSRGLQQLHQRVKAEFASSINRTLYHAITVIVDSPHRFTTPLPYDKFDQEQSEAIDQLKLILNRPDLNPKNIAHVVEEVLDQKVSDSLGRASSYIMLNSG
ncbi:Late competence development protein ComFB [Thalassoporum mexicanum PCC 7367]|uniref:late competence development ComFB family protein n=1 Tax=Thalassoporum mexicanum TaxID=3457544 RepID=UPI00029FC9C7|nr:late competence development ComFB family protein [Pseudanabaena sp. PCC 7367]AFY71389.1 Late competence development protein ComFB [Pseudanabaena sp. PCC 7367]